MIGLRAAALVLLAGILAGGCQKEKSGGGAGGGGGSPLDYPADTTALIGFVRTGPAPSAAQLNAALKAALGEEADREMVQLVDTCVAPVSAHLERTTIIVRGGLKDERAVVVASGAGLRPALEDCFKKMGDKRGKPLSPGQDGDYTVYPLGGGDPLIAKWTGTDAVVLGPSKEEIASASAPGGLKGTPLEKVVGAVDRSASIWFAAAGPGLPEQAELESVSGTVVDLRGAATATFKTPQAAQQAAAMAQMVIPKGIKVEGNQVKGGISVVDLPTLIPGEDKGKPMAKEHAQALVDAGPLMMAFFLIAGDEQPVEAAPPVPAEAAPAAPAEPTPP
ncbi:MAG TPA: hypothetical protein VFU21_12400 [Kofleriaceae bacterium]|nr:hypothetical protein [Kofleriaceae bacterium]